MDSFKLTTTVTALANVIACKLTAEEIALAASLFVQLGDTLATIAAAEVVTNDLCQDTETDMQI